jgi:uncharacterized lipoprotein YmbA
MRYHFLGRLLALSLGLGAACVNLGPATDPTRYFQLPLPEAAAAPTTMPVSIGVAEVALPDYLSGSHMVRRVSPTEVLISSSDYWAAPLGVQVRMALQEGLEGALGVVMMPAWPWRADQAPDLRVDVRVYRFDADTLGRAELEAAWSVSRSPDRDPVSRRRGTWRSDAAGPGTEDATVAMSQALQAMVSEIATAVRQIRP